MVTLNPEKPLITGPAVGARVGAVMSAMDGVVRLLGYGVRLEDEVPPAHINAAAAAFHEAGATNPCLLLDSGEKVFGLECWWGSEKGVKNWIGDRRVILVQPKGR